ncbi:MAG: hypothetical protein ACI3YB_02710 [Prevotella sp.]
MKKEAYAKPCIDVVIMHVENFMMLSTYDNGGGTKILIQHQNPTDDGIYDDEYGDYDD